MEIIKANPDKPWNWRFISMNPNITWDMILDNVNNHSFHAHAREHAFIPRTCP